jgi:hypothetical protein
VSGARSIVLALLAVASGGCAFGGCPTALLSGTLARAGADLVVVQADVTTPPQHLQWSGGYSVADRDGRLVVEDVFGSVKAAEGDAVALGGGLRPDDVWVVCSFVDVAPSAGS